MVTGLAAKEVSISKGTLAATKLKVKRNFVAKGLALRYGASSIATTVPAGLFSATLDGAGPIKTSISDAT